MRICFDSQIFGVQTYGGISRYFAGVAAELPRLGELDIRIAAPLHINAYLEQLPADMVLGRRVANPRGISLLRRLAGAALCERMQRRLAPEVFHKTYYHAFPRAPAQAKAAVTVYDLIQERFPQDFSPGNFIPKMKRLAVQKADHIFFISEHAKRDSLNSYPLDESRVSVPLPGFDSHAGASGDGKSRRVQAPAVRWRSAVSVIRRTPAGIQELLGHDQGVRRLPLAARTCRGLVFWEQQVWRRRTCATAGTGRCGCPAAVTP